MKDVKKLIKEYLDKAIVIQVATCVDNQPWACTVHFVADEDFNFYWLSTPARRHSQEIAKNPQVAGTVVLPHTMEDKPRGIQFEGIAELVADKQVMDKALEIYGQKFDAVDFVKKVADGSNEHRLYRIKPKRIVLFDLVNFPKNPQQEWQLS